MARLFADTGSDFTVFGKGGLFLIEKIKKEINEFKAFINAVPTLAAVFLVCAVFSMNLLANKSITLPFSWLALDCGIVVSWLVFLIMDTVTVHFGPKGATELTVFAIAVNLFFSLIFFIASCVPGVFGAAIGGDGAVNGAINKTFGGTWYIILWSAAAFLISAAVNNFLNFGIGKLFKKSQNGFLAYFARTYISTAVGQLADNFIFALTVSRVFFGWTLTQCAVCAFTGMLAELLCELIFSRLGFAVCRKWKRDGVGREYFELRAKGLKPDN